MNLQTYHIQSTLHEPIWFFVSNDLVEPSFKDVKVCRCPVDLKCSIHQLHLQRTSTTLNHQLASLNHTVTGGAGSEAGKFGNENGESWNENDESGNENGEPGNYQVWE